MKNFIDINQKDRIDNIIRWSEYIKTHNDWRESHNRFIDSILNQSLGFYNNMLKTKEGVDLVVKKFNIGNEKIIRRLKMQAKIKMQPKMIIRENKTFIRL